MSFLFMSEYNTKNIIFATENKKNKRIQAQYVMRSIVFNGKREKHKKYRDQK